MHIPVSGSTPLKATVSLARTCKIMHVAARGHIGDKLMEVIKERIFRRFRRPKRGCPFFHFVFISSLSFLLFDTAISLIFPRLKTGFSMKRVRRLYPPYTHKIHPYFHRGLFFLQPVATTPVINLSVTSATMTARAPTIDRGPNSSGKISRAGRKCIPLTRPFPTPPTLDIHEPLPPRHIVNLWTG